jgi:hypothetical protein
MRHLKKRGAVSWKEDKWDAAGKSLMLSIDCDLCSMQKPGIASDAAAAAAAPAAAVQDRPVFDVEQVTSRVLAGQDLPFDSSMAAFTVTSSADIVRQTPVANEPLLRKMMGHMAKLLGLAVTMRQLHGSALEPNWAAAGLAQVLSDARSCEQASSDRSTAFTAALRDILLV